MDIKIEEIILGFSGGTIMLSGTVQNKKRDIKWVRDVWKRHSCSLLLELKLGEGVYETNNVGDF